VDSDGDALGDDKEIALYLTDPLKADSDDDGLGDGAELGLYHTDPLKKDSDGDGLDDGDEVNQYHTDPLLVDTDGDGLSDKEEFDLYHTDPVADDTDADGLNDGVEATQYHTDPLQVDSDGDGLGDGNEVNQYHTDPLLADTDGDSLADGDEVNLYHTDPLQPDTDGDTIPDNVEIAMGSDPLRPESTPPDLIITLISGPTTAVLGQNITTTSTVRNLGGSTASNVKVDVYLSVNQVVPDGDDVYLGSYTLGDLSANQVKTTNAAFSIPPTLAEGNYHIGAVVDATNSIAESDETNDSTLSVDNITVGNGLSGDQSDGALSLVSSTFNLLTDSSDALGNSGDGNPGQPDGFATALTADASASTSRLSVVSTAGFVDGDEVLVIQISHATNHGVYEFIKNVTVEDGGTLIFSSELGHDYYVSNAATDRVEVIRVPQYSAVTVDSGSSVTTGPYSHDAGIGGVIALRASRMAIDGSINADGLGFAGGASVTVHPKDGHQGSSYTGISQKISRTRNLGGGGGGYFASSYGGGGGGYGTAGVKGYFSQGGGTYGSADLTRIYLGSGGGSGGTYNCADCNSSSIGGAGGGIIFVATDSITGIGSLSAAGGDGENFVANRSGPGAGGSGGTIRAQASVWGLSTVISGGAGGLGLRTDHLDDGGNGGDGRSAVSIGAPDLVISDIAVPLTAARGNNIAVTSTVRNQRADAATAPYKVGIYASLDPVISTEDIYLGDYALTDLTGNASVTTSVNVKIPAGIYADPPAGYQYRKQIAIHPVNGSGTKVLRDFPVLLDLNDPVLKSVAGGGRLETGYDVVFTDVLGTVLDYEVEDYDPATGHLRVWVRVPEQFGGVDTDIYLYYGNAAITLPQANASGVWNSHYKTVFHQDEVPGASSQLDSTVNGNDAPDTNMAGAQNVVDAVIGKGTNFDGINDYQRAQSAVLDTGANDWTFEAWVKLDTLNVGWSNIIQSADNPAGQRLLFVDSNDGRLYSDTGSQIDGPGQGIPLGAWNHVVLVHDQAGDRSKWYINGAWVATNSNEHYPSNNGVFWFGLGKDGSGALDGALDEIRVSDSQRSPEWIKAEYENMTSPSTFYSVGNEENAASFSTQYSFYIGAVVDYTDADVELNEFNNTDVARDSSGAPQAIIINY